MALLTQGRAEQREHEAHRQVAPNGKTVRGTQQHQAEDHKKRHPVRADETKTGVVLKEQVGGDTESEQTPVDEVLTLQDVKRRSMTADALQTQTNVCVRTTASGGMTYSSPKAPRPR